MLDKVLKAINAIDSQGLNTLPKFKRFIAAVPKVEIHTHLEALVSFTTLIKLNNKYNVDPSVKTRDEFREKYNNNKINQLSEMIQFFFTIQSFFKDEKDFKLLIRDIPKYLKKNNIYYIELHFSPSFFLKNGLDFERMMINIEDEIKSVQEKHDISINLLIDVSRTFGVENAKYNLDQLISYKKKKGRGKFILGIGLGGSEDGHPASDFKEIFEIARENNLKVVAHAGEEVPSWSIWDAINDLKVSRIGHGISAVEDDALMDHLIKIQLPLEICPTSNIATGKYVKKMEEHPIRIFFDKKIYVTLNSDDPILFDTELNQEFINLHTHMNFTLSEIMQIIKNNLFATFLSDKQKTAYWKMTLEKVNNAIRMIYPGII